jgi:NADH:ubiquinone oxidoreductase subunit K
MLVVVLEEVLFFQAVVGLLLKQNIIVMYKKTS